MIGLVVDASVAVALLTGEPGGGRIAELLEQGPRRQMSAASLLELGIVLETRFGPVGAAVRERFLRAGDIAISQVDREQAHLAIEAWRRFGKGRHPAGLNLGDCFTYALAAFSGATVLCTGDDFPRTDLPALRP